MVHASRRRGPRPRAWARRSRASAPRRPRSLSTSARPSNYCPSVLRDLPLSLLRGRKFGRPALPPAAPAWAVTGSLLATRRLAQPRTNAVNQVGPRRWPGGSLRGAHAAATCQHAGPRRPRATGAAVARDRSSEMRHCHRHVPPTRRELATPTVGPHFVPQRQQRRDRQQPHQPGECGPVPDHSHAHGSR